MIVDIFVIFYHLRKKKIIEFKSQCATLKIHYGLDEPCKEKATIQHGKNLNKRKATKVNPR